MKKHSVIFTGDQVRATLEGRMTRFRTSMKPQPHPMSPLPGLSLRANAAREAAFVRANYRCLWGNPGNRLWVKETWGAPSADHPLCKDGRKPQRGDRLVYLANDADAYQWGRGGNSLGDFVWRSSACMPRWASRLSIEILAVRAERLQSVSETDAAEGFTHRDCGEEICGAGQSFRQWWDARYAKRGFPWSSNPWVWCRSFRIINSALSDNTTVPGNENDGTVE